MLDPRRTLAAPEVPPVERPALEPANARLAARETTIFTAMSALAAHFGRARAGHA